MGLVAIALLLASGVVLVSGMLMNNGMLMNHGMLQNGMVRQGRFMLGGVPAPYRDMRNPLPATGANIRQGAQLYQTYCAGCHGSQGYGDGPAAAQLSPPPSNLRQIMHRPMMAGDGYLMWAISEGGRPVNSAMPAFKSILAEDARWKIIDFLLTL